VPLRTVIATADAMRREKSTSTPSVIREVRHAKSTISMESFDSNAECAGRLSAISFPRQMDIKTTTYRQKGYDNGNGIEYSRTRAQTWVAQYAQILI